MRDGPNVTAGAPCSGDGVCNTPRADTTSGFCLPPYWGSSVNYVGAGTSSGGANLYTGGSSSSSSQGSYYANTGVQDPYSTTGTSVRTGGGSSASPPPPPPPPPTNITRKVRNSCLHTSCVGVSTLSLPICPLQPIESTTHIQTFCFQCMLVTTCE